jgi:uncharacterized membrane protein (UPF0127 family)
MLMNARTGRPVVQDVEIASTSESRRRGLLGRESLDRSAALILVPCFSVHTAFMQFPIDVLFVDREGEVVRIVRNLEPWRVAASWAAHAVVELAGGAIGSGDVQVGDRLYLAAQRAPGAATASWPIPA